jgi:hypothetical protein
LCDAIQNKHNNDGAKCINGSATIVKAGRWKNAQGKWNKKRISGQTSKQTNNPKQTTNNKHQTSNNKTNNNRLSRHSKMSQDVFLNSSNNSVFEKMVFF